MDPVSGAAIRSVRFRREREADWRQLELLVRKSEQKGVRALGWTEAQRMARLYQQAANSLSVAREISLDKNLLEYLDGLVARAYLAVYAPQATVGGVLHKFLTEGAPRAFRASLLHIGLGVFCMLLGVAIGYGLFVQDESWYYVFVPQELAGGRGPGASTETLRGAIYGDHDESGFLAFASFLFSHNTRIAIFVFGLGAFFCLPTVLLTVYNGALLGAFLALHVDRGLGWDIGGWLSIHGVTEIGAICIAAAGGLRLGSAILFPGNMTRRDALRHQGRDAVKLALIAALMLFAAAFLEGFGRQMVQDMTARYVIGWGIGALWLAWLLGAGREKRA